MGSSLIFNFSAAHKAIINGHLGHYNSSSEDRATIYWALTVCQVLCSCKQIQEIGFIIPTNGGWNWSSESWGIWSDNRWLVSIQARIPACSYPFLNPMMRLPHFTSFLVKSQYYYHRASQPQGWKWLPLIFRLWVPAPATEKCNGWISDL